MNILIFGATGMVGQGVMRECLRADDVDRVRTIGRTRTGLKHARLSEIVQPDLFDVEAYAVDLAGFDACFFCLGVSSAGMREEAYTRLTFDLTLDIAKVLVSLNPHMTFVYVSGTGTDETETSRSMWARVKGRTENALRGLPFKAVYLFRPAAILPANGERSGTAVLRYFYVATGWLLRPLRKLARGYILTTEEVGCAMLKVARNGWPTPIMEPAAIRAAAQSE